jgi:uncharacterized repeat protein (TIGR03843 family)
MAAFDAVVNNADRKGGHVIATVEGRLYGVDHGVCFHTDDKLRTVLWGWAGEELPDEVVAALRKLCLQLGADLGAQLAKHLSAEEIGMLRVRVERLLATRTFPVPGDGWPAIPWPPI